ncbi:UNVERIFIED_CONTAM: hypothetical protein NCL1_14490 [Trichonephila clavipes]
MVGGFDRFHKNNELRRNIQHICINLRLLERATTSDEARTVRKNRLASALEYSRHIATLPDNNS